MDVEMGRLVSAISVWFVLSIHFISIQMEEKRETNKMSQKKEGKW